MPCFGKTFLSTEVCAINITIGNAPRQRPRCVLHVNPMTVDEIITALNSTSAASRSALLVGLAHADELAPVFYAVAGKFCQGIHLLPPDGVVKGHLCDARSAATNHAAAVPTRRSGDAAVPAHRSWCNHPIKASHQGGDKWRTRSHWCQPICSFGSRHDGSLGSRMRMCRWLSN